MQGLLGKKIGMTQVFDQNSNLVVVTAVEAGPCTVMSLRTRNKDGYAALQLGYGHRKAKNVSAAVRGCVSPAGFKDFAPEWIREIRLNEDPSESIGDKVTVDEFKADEYVDVVGTTKGKGFQGVVRRYRFGGGRASHGGDWTRRPGSIGMCEKPGKVYKGRKMPGQMGNARTTIQNLKIIKILKDDNVLLIKGAIPGPNGGRVIIRQAKKIKSSK